MLKINKVSTKIMALEIQLAQELRVFVTGSVCPMILSQWIHG